MDYKEIKKLMDDFGESKLTEIELEYPDGVKIKLKKDGKEPKMPPIPMHEPRTSMVPIDFGMPYAYPAPGMPVAKQENSGAAQKLDANSGSKELGKQEETGNVVKSPMVGTFYSKSSPTSESFVKVGSRVKKGDTLCIIEAMKLMNEIESEFDGEVLEVLVKDGEMVDYGKPLFIIK
jgi:acetyl-CoA carboxylase biotin carboxyl carrier protein